MLERNAVDRAVVIAANAYPGAKAPHDHISRARRAAVIANVEHATAVNLLAGGKVVRARAVNQKRAAQIHDKWIAHGLLIRIRRRAAQRSQRPTRKVND